jgi:hypothetical protein
LISRKGFSQIAIHRTHCTLWSLRRRLEGEANHEDPARHLTPTEVITSFAAERL